MARRSSIAPRNPFKLMPPSQRLLDVMRRQGVDTSKRSEVDAWVQAWREGGYK